jgi:hypothetical protein
MSSDHKPVRASFTIQLPNSIREIPDQNIGQHELVFSAIVCSNMGQLQGANESNIHTDPYIRFSGDPLFLLQEDMRLTRSAIKHRTVHPVWSAHDLPVLLLRTASLGAIAGCQVNLQIFNSMDKRLISMDELLSHFTLPLKKAIEKMGHFVHFKENLTRYGHLAGMIEGSFMVRERTLEDYSTQQIYHSVKEKYWGCCTCKSRAARCASATSYSQQCTSNHASLIAIAVPRGLCGSSRVAHQAQTEKEEFHPLQYPG